MHQKHGNGGLPTVKTAVFSASYSLPPVAERGGRLFCSADEKASLCSTNFDGKQCRDSFQQLHSSDPSPLLCSVSFRSSFVRSVLLNIDSYDGNGPDRMFTLFYK